MSRTNPVPAILGLLLVMTSHCGTGGIVDNGDKPTPQPDGKASHSPLAYQTLNVLDSYKVKTPDGTWSATSDTTTTTVTNTVVSIAFTYATKACDVVPVKDPLGVDLYTCSPTQTILLVPDGHFISAVYSELDVNVDAILKSFTTR